MKRSIRLRYASLEVMTADAFSQKFFEKVELTTPKKVEYMSVKAGASEKEKVFPEFHKDFYAQTRNSDNETGKERENSGATHNIDRKQAQQILNERLGTVEDVSL